ncbi:MAG: single-stranded-DNA-specific exonuclease RecJ [Lawsonibacter sp.]|jgi:single-stranded-DNA-specific exonuclease
MKYPEWKIAPPCPESRQELEKSGVSPLLAAVLSARGVADPEKAWALLEPQGEELLSPLAMQDMSRAVQRVRMALEQGERLAVYGDYDVDGITATCLLTQFLQREGAWVVPYIPGRLEEGYGLNREAVTTLAQQGVTLLITVDCGITAVDEVEYAAQLGMDVVVTDHHACKETLPPAVAVVDPHRPDCRYPFKGLAGVGVALKLAMAVAGITRAEEILACYGDLAAVGTIADVMPMTGENRYLVRRGLRDLNPPKRLGLEKLIACAGLEEKAVTSVAVGYTLAPRINASGRMGRSEVAVELLLTQNPIRAEQLAEELCQLNRERQVLEGDIFQQCIQRLEQVDLGPAIVLSSANWHQGVVGIVASRLAEKYSRPAFMVCLDQGLGKGSCRSWGGVNLFAALQSCSSLLESFGGHALAAGFTVREKNLPALEQALCQAVAEQGNDQEACTLEADALVRPEELTVEGVEALEGLEPWGTGNPRPVLVLQGVQVTSLTQVGRGRHLKLRLESRGIGLEAIWFSADGSGLDLVPGCRVDVAFYPQINEFRGQRTVQLQVVDLRRAPSRAQLERAIYEKFCRGEALSPQEARFLLPERADFVSLWRWLERQSAAGDRVEETLVRITRSVGRCGGRGEVPARTMLCLEVLEEQGLIDLSRNTGRMQITIHHLEQKVDLEESGILRRLREASQDSHPGDRTLLSKSPR